MYRMRIDVAAWQCEYPDCGHIWLATSEKTPDKCAKCRRRRWNEPAAVPTPAERPAHWPQTGESQEAYEDRVDVEKPDEPALKELTIERGGDYSQE
jgi:hypothetical protein